MTICYRVLGIETANAANNSDPLLPYLLLRTLIVPILLTPFVFLLSIVKFLKSRK